MEYMWLQEDYITACAYFTLVYKYIYTHTHIHIDTNLFFKIQVNNLVWSAVKTGIFRFSDVWAINFIHTIIETISI